MSDVLRSKLSAAEALFKATFEQAAVGIAHVSPLGSWLRVNQRLCEIVGYSRDELMLMTFQDVTHPDDLDADLQYVQKMLNMEIDTYSMEKRYFRKDGNIVWVNLTVSLVWEEEGEKPAYFISVVEDISAKKIAEIEIRELGRFLVDLQEIERRALALELHDEVGQKLSAAMITLGSVKRNLVDAKSQEMIVQVQSIVTNLIFSIKNMAQRLRPSLLDDFGLRAAIKSLIEEYRGSNEVAVTFVDEIGETRFHEAIELAGYRITQEALSNAVRHAKSRGIEVRLSLTETEVRIDIVDDGCGFLIGGQNFVSTIGLVGMRERAFRVQGKLSIRSALGQGTKISAQLPIGSPG